MLEKSFSKSNIKRLNIRLANNGLPLLEQCKVLPSDNISLTLQLFEMAQQPQQVEITLKQQSLCKSKKSHLNINFRRVSGAFLGKRLFFQSVKLLILSDNKSERTEVSVAILHKSKV